MLTDVFGIIFLLLTGIVALIVGIILIKEYMAKNSMGHLFIGIGFLVLFVSGVLIILFGFEILENPIIPPVAALIPVGIATGLLFAIYDDKPKIAWGFLSYELVMIIITSIIRLGGNTDTPLWIMAIHIPGGLVIFFLPIFSGENKAWMISIGGALISVGGMLLAFLKLSTPLFGIFTAEVIFAILPPLLLIVGAFFTLGLIYPEKWRIEVPVISAMLIK